MSDICRTSYSTLAGSVHLLASDPWALPTAMRPLRGRDGFCLHPIRCHVPPDLVLKCLN